MRKYRMVFELRYRPREDSLGHIVTYRSFFPLARRPIGNCLRSRIASWTEKHGRPVLTKLQFSFEEWLEWIASDEYAAYLRDGHRTADLPQELAHFFGCDQVVLESERNPETPAG